MGYDDEAGRSRRRQSRDRQPVKRPGAREPEYRKNTESRYEEARYREERYERSREREARYEDNYRREDLYEDSYDRPYQEVSRRKKRELDLITDSFQDTRREEPLRETSRSRKQAAAVSSKGSKKPASKKSSKGSAALRQTAATKQGDNGAYRTPEQKKAQKRKRKLLIILLEIVALISVLLFAAYSYLNKSINMIQRLPWNPDDIKNVEISEEKQEQMKGYWTIAVFGVDSRNSSVGKGNNSDVNIICNINQDTGEIKLVSVFRDTYLNINDKNSYNKINAAYLQGGPEQAVKALNKNLDLDIDDYATFNWKAVADGINILGGIDLELSKAEFYYINAFVTETVKATGVPSEPVKHAGMVHLDGVQAVAYGRLRLMDTDYARTERQRKIISLAFDKAKTADWATLNNIVQTVFPQVATSVEISDVLRMGRDIGKLHLGETTGFPAARGEADMGKKGACVIPQTLENNVVALHQLLFDDEDYQTTDTVKTISKKIISDTGLAKSAKPVESVDTKGGAIPKLKAETEHESKIKESSTASYKESGTESESAGKESKPGKETAGWQQWETDSKGNWVEPATRESTSKESTSKESTSRDNTPKESTLAESESGITRPGTTTTKPDTSNTKPGSTQSTEETISPRPGSGTINGGGSNAPGSGTDTGVIIGPGNGAPGSSNNSNTPGSGNGSNAPGTGNIEFTGPMGP